MKNALLNSVAKGLLLTCVSVICSYFIAPALNAQRNLNEVTLGDGHVVYGDLKVGGDAAGGNFQISLYAGLNIVSQQTIGPNGRYRFLGIPNGEYVIVVEFENQVVTRMPIRLADPRKNDFRFDIQLEQRAPATAARKAGVVLYARSAANQSLFDKAAAFAEKKDLDQATASMLKVVTDDPKDFVAWTELGTLYFKQNKLSEAEKAYAKAIEAKPDFVLALLNMGKLLIAQKNYEKAAEVLTQAVTAEPNSADSQQFLGEAYLGLKKGSKAVGHLNEALRLDPVGKADVHLRLGALYNAAGMKDRAAAEYEQFLVKRPDYAEKKKLQDYISQNKKS